MCHLNFLQKWPLIIHELTSKPQIIREAAIDEGALDALICFDRDRPIGAEPSAIDGINLYTCTSFMG